MTATEEDVLNVVRLVVEEDRRRDNRAAQARVLPPPTMPMQVAREFLGEHHTFEDGTPTVRFWRGGWWWWRTSHWQEVEECAMRSALYQFTENATYETDKETKPWAPNRHRIGDLIEALSAITLLPTNTDQPRWLDDRTTGSIVATTNGLLDVEQRQLYPHTPHYFDQTSVPFDYDPNAPEPERWLNFLGELWRDEPEAIDVLGEWFGYVISGRLDLHKILLMVGPTRGGKGIIARILGALIGRENVAGPTLNSLGGETRRVAPSSTISKPGHHPHRHVMITAVGLRRGRPNLPSGWSSTGCDDTHPNAPRRRQSEPPTSRRNKRLNHRHELLRPTRCAIAHPRAHCDPSHTPPESNKSP